MVNKNILRGPMDKGPAFRNFYILTLLEVLPTIDIGQTIDYGELSRRCGFRVTGGSAHYQTAKRRLVLDGLNFRTVFAVGVLRLDDTGIVKESSRGLERIGRKVRFERRKVQNANFANLSNSDLLEAATNISILGMQEAFLHESTRTRIESRNPDPHGLLEFDLSKTLELFS